VCGASFREADLNKKLSLVTEMASTASFVHYT
jgi:hypothetical protein